MPKAHPPEPGLFGSILKASVGAAVVLGAAYVVSRMRDKRGADERLARLEQLAERLGREMGNKAG